MPLFNSSRPLLSAHPAHYAFTIFLLFTCVVLYYRQASFPSIYKERFTTAGTSKDLTLAERLQRSEEIFQRSRAARKELTDAFGPDPQSYPFTSDPNGPWPAMTVYDFVRQTLILKVHVILNADGRFPTTTKSRSQLYPSFNCPFDVERLGATVSLSTLHQHILNSRLTCWVFFGLQGGRRFSV